jgi:hypothetical protein
MSQHNLSPAAMHQSAAMQGFHAEFRNLDDYIRVITDRIWEGRQIESIRDYYSDPCVVITPSGATTDVQSVIDGTKATLAQFPDRRLLAEDVIESGNAQEGFLSSHRIISTMTHLGDGNFGKATGRKIHVRTVADCVCKDNRIVHEWLVRDQGAIARAVGTTPQALAVQWLKARKEKLAIPLPLPPAPLWWHNPMSQEPLAQAYAEQIGYLLSRQASNSKLYDEAVCSISSSNHMAYGRVETQHRWQELASSLQVNRYIVESLTFMNASSSLGRAPRLALRWRVQAQSTGQGLFAGLPGKSLDILGINHVEFVKIGKEWEVHREWVLLDEVAVWMQLLDGQE